MPQNYKSAIILVQSTTFHGICCFFLLINACDFEKHDLWLVDSENNMQFVAKQRNKSHENLSCALCLTDINFKHHVPKWNEKSWLQLNTVSGTKKKFRLVPIQSKLAIYYNLNPVRFNDWSVNKFLRMWYDTKNDIRYDNFSSNRRKAQDAASHYVALTSR